MSSHTVWQQRLMTSLLNLNQAPVGLDLIIRQLRVPADARDWQPWLEEIGFLQGEHVTVRRRSLLRKGAVVVRVGHSTFALHPEEAACIWVDVLNAVGDSDPLVDSAEPNSESRV